jgi:hypothetical protein
MARITWKEPDRTQGAKFWLLRPICWILGHGIYQADGEGWLDAKLECPRCGCRFQR